MTDETNPGTVERYLIRKGGYYYRPNAQGYTGNKAEAGRYTLEEAISYSHPNGPNGPRDGISYELDTAAQSQPAATVQEVGRESDVEAVRRSMDNAIAQVAADAIRASFFTSVSGGGQYYLSLAYPTMDAMHKAEDQIKAFLRWPRFLPLEQRLAALTAEPAAKAECPSCHGMNTSCPDGCGRDPATGELNGTRLEPSPQPDMGSGGGLSAADAWQDLVDKDDRTSPEEYPDMALITREELADYMQAAAPSGRAQGEVK